MYEGDRGCTVAARAPAVLTERRIATSYTPRDLAGQLTVHSGSDEDPLAPHVSNESCYSQAQLKSLKFRPNYSRNRMLTACLLITGLPRKTHADSAETFRSNQ